MAKRELYNLGDEELLYLVHNLGKQMSKEEMPYLLVGGTAVQAHILKRLHERTGKTLSQLVEDPEIRLQDYIRSTDDIDLAIHSSVVRQLGDVEFGKRINRILDGLTNGEVISPSEEHILDYSLARRGIQRPVFQISVDSETDTNMQIAMNIGRKPEDLHGLDEKFYDGFINEGQEVSIPYNDKFTLRTRIIKPEHLLASKIAQFRPKDTMDLHNLSDMMREGDETLDLTEIKGILLPEYSINYGRFLEVSKIEDPEFEPI